jgi:hypothetical protein
MTLLTIALLGIFACICNATQDEIRFRWPRLFAHWFPDGGRAAQWFNPSLSWTNKWLNEHMFVKFVMSTVLVFTTDFWHLLKFLIITCVFLMVLIALRLQWSFWEYVVAILLLHVAWGGVFEGFFRGIYGGLSDKYEE